MGLLDRVTANLDKEIAAESSAEQAREERRAARLAKQKEMLAQPGYIWTVYFNSNAPYTASQGWYLASCKLTETVNGAAALPEGFSSKLTAWSYKAEQIVARNKSSFQVQVFVPESDFADEETVPFFEIDLIINEGGITGRLCQDAEGNETIVGRGMPIPTGYETVKEIALRFQVEPFLVPGSERYWNPQANNPFAGMQQDKVAELVNKSAALFKRKQESGLNAWRTARDSATNAAIVNDTLQDAATGLPTTEKAPRKARVKAV